MQNTSTHIDHTDILVVGATGKTGRRVIKGLHDKGISARSASRNSNTPFDWEKSATWDANLEGIKSVYLTFFPDLAVPSASGAIELFCEKAKSAGVEHITLLSGRGESLAQKCEDIVKQSGLKWTIIRSSWFNQNFSEGVFRDYVMHGVMAFPVSDVKEPFVDIDDIAEIAIASLLDKKHNKKLYEVTGPELLSFTDLARKFNRKLNHNVKFIEISLLDFEKSLVEMSVPQNAIEMLKYLFIEVLDGRNQYLTNGIEQALGRQPTSFDVYIDNNRASFEE